MDISAQAVIDALIIQRNKALDDSIQLFVELSKARAEIQTLEKALEEAKKPQPPAAEGETA